jgi:hypothetical protein
MSPPTQQVGLGRLSSDDANRLATILRSRYAVPIGLSPPWLFFANDKSTPDIPISPSLPQDLAYIATHIGTGEALSSQNPADLLALFGSQSLVDLARIIAPVFNSAVHGSNSACRGPDKLVPGEIPFTVIANFVSTPSGNENLIFSSGVDEPALHYNAQQGVTRGSGSLLSDDGLSFIDVSQFTGSSLPIIDNLMNKAVVNARACLVAKPEQCTEVGLQRK